MDLKSQSSAFNGYVQITIVRFVMCLRTMVPENVALLTSERVKSSEQKFSELTHVTLMQE